MKNYVLILKGKSLMTHYKFEVPWLRKQINNKSYKIAIVSVADKIYVCYYRLKHNNERHYFGAMTNAKVFLWMWFGQETL